MLNRGERTRVEDASRLAAVRATGLLDSGPDPQLVRLVELTASLLRVPAAQITLVDDERSYRAASTGLAGIGADVRQQPVENAFCVLAMESDSAALVADTATDARAQRLQPGTGGPVRAWAGAPVRTEEGLVLGSLCVLDTRPHDWTADDGQVLVAMAHAVSAEVALRAANRREDDTRARADFQGTLLRATHEATLDGVLVVSPEGRLLTWNSRFGAIWGIEADAFESGSDDVALASVLRTVVDPEGFMARVRALYADPEPSRDEIALRDDRVLDRYGTPLFGEDGTYHGYAWFVRDVSAERSAQHAAQVAAESTRVLQEVTAALSGAVTTADVMTVILDHGAEVLGASGSGVAIRHGDRVRYEVLTGYSADVKSSWSEFSMSEDSPVTRTLRTGMASFIGSRTDLFAAFAGSERLRAFVEASGEHAFVRLPLLTPSGVIGVLAFGFEAERSFTADVRRFALALAAQCAQALERARLYERERGTARMLQRSLLPEALPLVIGMRLAALCHAATADTDVGGDWYDALVLADGRVALAVGDVRGRGVRAASVMGQVRNALRGLVHADPSPPAMLAWLDAVVARLGDDEEFVTLVYAVADPRTGRLEWACAGHMPPLAVRPGGARYLTGAESLPLGLGGDRPHAVLELEPGEALVLFSDGLVENRYRSLGSGLARLQDQAEALLGTLGVPAADDLRDSLTAAMVDDRGNDDVTVLTIRRAVAAQGVGGHPVGAQLDLPARPTSPGTARSFVGARLGEWGAHGVVDPAVLCVSELVTNAVVHAGSSVHLELHCGEGVLRVDVRDTGRAPLAAARPAAGVEDTHGRGLMMVDVVADRWGVVDDGEGKVVWFELALG